MKIHVGNQGLGLCAYVTSRCGVEADRDREEELYARCKATPRSVLACSEYHGTRAETFECQDRLEAALCPPAVTSP